MSQGLWLVANERLGYLKADHFFVILDGKASFKDSHSAELVLSR